MGVWFSPLVLLLVVCMADHAFAQSGPTVGADAMPGLSTVGVAQAKANTWAVAATGGFGSLSPQADEGAHQRLFGSVAGAFAITEGVAVGLRLDGRYDMHPDDSQGSDDSLVGEPTLRVRVATPVSDRVHVGAELALMIPGKDAPSLAFDALRADARLLATYVDDAAWGVASLAGFRFDKSGNAAPDLSMTRPGDRLSLGLNDFHAVLLGVGAWKRVGALELLGELTWNPWLGSGAPSALQSPLHIVAGARYHSSQSLAWELLLDGLLSQRPEPEGNKLAAMDPRFSVQVGVRLMGGYAAPAAVPVEDPSLTADPTDEPALVAANSASVRGRVIDKDAQPVADAEVTIVAEGFEQATTTSSDGSYQIDNVPLGPATLRVRGRRLQPTEQTLQVVAAGVSADVQPERLPAQGQLRGLVRSFDGKPLAAHIAISPSDQTLNANAEGEFELTLTPGEYQVRISIAGFGAQSRTVQIEDDGVTLLNVDLKKARR